MIFSMNKTSRLSNIIISFSLIAVWLVWFIVSAITGDKGDYSLSKIFKDKCRRAGGNGKKVVFCAFISGLKFLRLCIILCLGVPQFMIKTGRIGYKRIVRALLRDASLIKDENGAAKPAGR